MRSMLVVVDMQKDFVDGALGTAEAVAIVPAVVEKIRSYPPDCVWATRDTHQADYLTTQEGRHLPVEHCIEGTAGWQLCPEVAAALPREARIFDKPTFGSVELAQALPRILIQEAQADIKRGAAPDFTAVIPRFVHRFENRLHLVIAEPGSNQALACITQSSLGKTDFLFLHRDLQL